MSIPSIKLSDSPSEVTSSSGGAVAAGKVVFNSSSCGGCHTFTAAGGAFGTVGPNLDTAPATGAAADGNMALDAFIRESIVDPSAYIADGYSDIMTKGFGTSFTSKQIDDLVAFILSGTQH